MDNIKFERNIFGKRVKSMLSVDFQRMFKTRFLYIMLAICFLMPVLILVMTTMMDGTVSVDPQTGKETVIEGFDNTWQIIGFVSNTSMMQPESSSAEGTEAMASMMDMGITSMCNINMLYFALSVLVCVFVSGDFISGYAKNLFTVRAKKTDYVISKTVVCSIGCALMILAFVAGSLIGGAVAGLPFEMTGFSVAELVMCIISKTVLVTVFVPIYLVMSVIAKNKLWLSILLSMMVGMFLFMMIPMLTPLNSGIMNVFLCAVGGVLFSVGLGAVSNKILEKTSLV